jgi:peptide methionine sulfoxide reductase msrA/msrB
MIKAGAAFLIVVLLGLIGCDRSDATAAAAPSDGAQGGAKAAVGSKDMVRVRVIGADGKLTSAVDVKKLVLSDDEWKKRLTAEQYRIGRNKGTEPAFCGGLLHNKVEGVYVCVGCNLPLFASNAKFDSGSGWPSFFQPIAKENVIEHVDRAYGMVRTEILCPRCDMHLGHVFDDGPRPTGLRYCLNSDVMKFVAEDQLKTIAETVPVAATQAIKAKSDSGKRAEAVFAGGCFWCVEAVFEEIDGVYEVISGYSGGDANTANYEAVCSGTTGHAEAVKIVYDPAKVSLEQLLKIHFATHDATTLNRQGHDEGTQYRSAIFYANDEQKEIAKAFIADLTDSKAFAKPIVTTLEPLKKFYPAETVHQNFVCQNPNYGYVQAVAMPKVEKVREKFKDMLKTKTEPGK